MKNKSEIDLANIVRTAAQLRESNRISDALQRRILRRCAGTDDFSKLEELIAENQFARLFRQKVIALHAQIAKEVAESDRLLAVRKAEREVFLIEDRTPEDKPEIEVDEQWWNAQEKLEREAKKAIRRKLKAGEFVPENDLVKYGFSGEQDEELVEAY